jgi:hypothetical protein
MIVIHDDLNLNFYRIFNSVRKIFYEICIYNFYDINNCCFAIYIAYLQVLDTYVMVYIEQIN